MENIFLTTIFMHLYFSLFRGIISFILVCIIVTGPLIWICCRKLKEAMMHWGRVI